MNYYKMKIRAIERIKALVRQGVDDETIIYNIMTNFGFSENTIRKLIETIRKFESAEI